MQAAEFQRRLRALEADHPPGGVRGSVACVRCEDTVDSTFCEDAAGLVRCHYCVRSRDLVDCAHVVDSSGCVGCQHCVGCTGCVACAYVERSRDCVRSTYCFGCVGLVGKDFHLLNEPLDRDTWFRVVAELRAALGAAGPRR